MTDDELYSLFLAGDMSAADALMGKYAGRLIMYTDAIIHDMRDAEDLVIETFAVIMTKRPVIRPGGFQAYLYQAARRRAVRFRLRRRRTSVFSLDEEGTEIGTGNENLVSGLYLELATCNVYNCVHKKNFFKVLAASGCFRNSS